MEKLKLISSKNSSKGFTLIELLVVITINSILFALIAFNFVGVQNQTSQRSSVNSILSDLKLQQVKAMNGATEGRDVSDNFGIYFLADQYVLFHGTTYDPADSTNFAVELPENVRIESTTFANNTILFSKVSGEIMNYIDGSNTINVRESNLNKLITITLNRYGVITGAN